MDIAQILAATNVGEDSDWEFKSAKGGLPRSLWETYSAMANTDGGTILLGVEDDGTITGVSDVFRKQSDFWSTINNRGHVSQNLLTDSDLAVVKIDGGDVVVIRVPRATRRQRPIFLNQNPLTGTYRRNHEGDYHCSEDEVGRMLADKAEQPADSEILDGFGLNDLDPASLTQYRNRFSARTPQHPWLSEDIQGLLEKLGGWRTDRQTGKNGMTVAGLLMFGRDEAIRDPAALPQYHVDFREKLSDEPEVRWTDRLTVDGTWTGNLFQFYQRVIVKLTTDLKIPFQLDKDLFRKDDTIVHEAVREALVNALIHADYRGQGGIVVERYAHRIELSNPGSLLVSFDQMMKGGVSECRNKSLQLMFQMIGGGEKAGSGIDKIRQGWKTQKWRWPLIQTRMQPDRVAVVLPMISLLPEESMHRLRGAMGTAYGSLSADQVQALVTADVEGSVSNLRLQQFLDCHTTDITKLLADLVANGWLIKDGYGRWATYRLARERFPNTESAQAADSSDNDPDSSDKAGNSSDIRPNPSGKAGNPSDIRPNPSDNDTDSERNIASKYPELWDLASECREKSRLQPETAQLLILQLCAGSYLSYREIGDLLGRDARYVRDSFLKPLVIAGKLRLKFPNEPAHPRQAYTTAETPEEN